MRASMRLASEVWMSCSQIAQASASKATGRRDDAQPRPAAQRGPDQRVVAKALVERAQVVVDAEREAHPRDRRLGAGAILRPGAEQHAALAGLRDAHDGRAAVEVQQPLEHAAAPAQDPVAAAVRGQPERRAGHDLEAQLVGHGADATPPAGRRRYLPRSPSTCTSTRNERLASTGASTLRRRRTTRRARRRCTIATVAAPAATLTPTIAAVCTSAGLSAPGGPHGLDPAAASRR